MGPNYPPHTAAQATAVITGSFLSGAMMGISLMTVRVFLDTDTQASQLLRQWVRLYHYGHQVMPSMAVATFLLYGYIALSKRASQRLWRVYAIAGAISVTMVPFTWIVMAPTNSRLFDLDTQSSKGLAKDGILNSVQQLVIRWGWLHVVRSFFPLAGAIIGLTATLEDLRA